MYVIMKKKATPIIICIVGMVFLGIIIHLLIRPRLDVDSHTIKFARCHLSKMTNATETLLSDLGYKPVYGYARWKDPFNTKNFSIEGIDEEGAGIGFFFIYNPFYGTVEAGADKNAKQVYTEQQLITELARRIGIPVEDPLLTVKE